MKIRNTSLKQRNRVLKSLFEAKKPYINTVAINDDFYKLCGYSVDIVEISLNYFSAKGYIDLIAPDPDKGIPPYALIRAEAYTYFPDLKDRMVHFWIPIVISIISLIVSAVAIAL